MKKNENYIQGIMSQEAIISIIGMMITSGMGPEELVYRTFQTTSIFFPLFIILGLLP